VNIDGTGRRRVVLEENDTSPEHACWSPDGKSLAYTMEDWQGNERGKKVLPGGIEANPRMAIIDVEGKNPRLLNLARARWLGAPDWR
jgi:Tol biopolymer transport system component